LKRIVSDVEHASKLNRQEGIALIIDSNCIEIIEIAINPWTRRPFDPLKILRGK
jgi:hypothetical protein